MGEHKEETMSKGYLRGFLIATVAAAALASLPVQASAGLPGDINGDGVVSIAEVQTTINAFLGLIASDTVTPSAPTNVAASALSGSQIRLTWTAATDNVGVVGYKVFRGGTLVATVQSATYTDTGLTAATSYSYTVVAFDAGGNVSAQSSAAQAATQGSSTPTLVGSWYVPYPDGGPAKGPIVFNFIDSTKFMMAHDGSSADDPSGQPGIEVGTYTRDSATGAFTANVTVDTNGQWGFSHPDGPIAVTFSTDGNTLLLNGSSFATRVLKSSTNPLVGGWYVPYPNGGPAKGPITFTFIDDTNFMMAHDGDVTADPSGTPGIEKGTYSWNQTTGALTTSVTVDTNGQWGFSHSGTPTVQVSTDGNTLLIDGSPFATRIP